ncbi:MAG: hypothetical protein NT166_21250 [Candidatus Aminicenantes bacterium]|nr:hypothetical protein [Candidatus Aminicenantes bacterium]
MEYALKERIGKPELFTGRNEEMTYFLKWINDIKDEKSQSTAILARRKMGKTAILERLFNITFFKNDGVIPFYYEIKETEMWVGDFCVQFFLSFIYQYIAFKTRKTEYLKPEEKSNFEKVIKIVKKEGLGYLSGIIESAAHAASHENIDILWDIVRDTPQTVAFRQKEFIVQMIDEFQFLNAMIYRDKDMKIPAKDLAGGYLSSAESKIAPLLISGSWVGWLMNELNSMLPNRFKYEYLENMPEDEALEMLYKYSSFFDVPVTEETAYLIIKISEGSPFYTSSILRSRYKHKDLTTVKGLTDTLDFETLDNRGNIKSTWMEYVNTAFSKVNNRNAKRIVLHLFKYKDRELTREEILNQLALDMTDEELEQKLEALVKGDIIDQGQTHFDFRCVRDNIFDKVFRGVYQKEIEHFDVKDIAREYAKSFEKLKRQYRRLQGKYHSQKGYFAEYLILDQLTYRARKNNDLFKAFTRYLPGDFNFCEYSRVWRYDSSPEYSRSFSVDIFARAVRAVDYSIIGEVKSREVKKFSMEEVIDFERKFAEVKKYENIERVVGFIYSRCGFTAEAEEYCKEKGIACSDDERWIG